MRLKRVSMSGFKSFADKVEFEFAPGVTCIVGPNGCGKSNVVDAFKWVLGEQSARSLRGRQMMDMIFNGSANRKSRGMAQVDLVFENLDRTLPVDRDEVSITRKLFRSGESEYLLCGEPSRLKDIRELFLDTGIGTNAYAVIEQGKVEGLLHSSATDRRIIFEEAAGISKYRARKREAERKLGRTDQNLLRVADIIEEVEKRLRSVKLQAGKARNFQTYDARLRELRASFSMAEYHRLSQDLQRIQGEVDADTDEATRLRTTIDQNEAEAARTQGELDKLAEEITANDDRLVISRSEMTANEERVEAARGRIVEQREALSRAEARQKHEQTRHGELAAELEEVNHQAHALQEETLSQNSHIDALADQETHVVREITQTQAVLEDEKAGVFDLLRRTSQLHNEITSLGKHGETLAGQKGRLSERDAVIAGELQGESQRKGALQAKLHEVEELIESETKRLEEKKEAARVIDAERAALAEELASAKEARSAMESREAVLADLQKQMEGVGAGVRRILDHHTLAASAMGDDRDGRDGRDGDGDGGGGGGGGGGDGAGDLRDVVQGLVANVFETDVPRAKIVEAAVGEHDQDLVVSDSQRFLAWGEVLRDLPERTTVMCLDRLGPVINVRDFSDQPGFVAPALDFVRYEARYEMLARTILGKTVVVDTLDNAFAMAQLDDDGHRFVTLAGEIVEADGRVRLGPPHTHAGLISRITELRSIAEQLAALEANIERLSDELNRRSAQTQHLEQVQQELRTGIYELHTARVETNAALENATEAIRRLSAEQPLIAGEVASIEQELAEAQARAEANKDSVASLEKLSQAREEQVKRYKLQIEELTAQRADVSERLTEARVAIGQLLEKRAAAAETINALRRSIREAEEGAESAQHEMAACQSRITESEETIESCGERLAELRQRVEEIETRAAELRHDRDAHRQRLEELTVETKHRRSDLEKAEQRLHEHQMTLQEAGIRRDELVARVREELKLELAELYEAYEHAEQDWTEVEEEIAALKQKISRLGNINLDAIAEQEELEERDAFLTTQRDDLENSRKQLDTLIAQLNEESRKRFIEAFDAIRENFRELFRKLFGGGKADIILENPEDVLESGIEILARPPGKELQSITLMSGGEKSMTAIALLMSIFRSRPSPFAILDEVDAALDEANNERFNGIIREFLDRSQFIIITHSKRTMGIGDQLYGVTMQEPGVSTRVSVKFEKTEQSADTAVA